MRPASIRPVGWSSSRHSVPATRPEAQTHVGRRALRALMAGRGSVLAAFESALYLEGAGGIACLVPRSAPSGPLNVPVDGFRPGTPGLHGRAWRFHGGVLAVDGFGTFTVSPRDEWTPSRLPAPSPVALLAGVASMRTALAARAPRGELILHVLSQRPHPCSVDEFARSDHEEPMALADHECRRPEPPAAAAPRSVSRSDMRKGDEVVVLAGRAAATPRPVSRSDALGLHFARTLPALARWLDDAFGGRDGAGPSPIVDLLGAGSGLTPSGDDCIVGLLVALHALGARDVAATVACVVARHAPHRTGRLSAAHLDAACAGEAIEPLHAAVAALAAGTSPEPALDALERFGHGSGFDALAGVLLAADAIAHNRMYARCFRRSTPSGTDGTRTPARRP